MSTKCFYISSDIEELTADTPRFWALFVYFSIFIFVSLKFHFLFFVFLSFICLFVKLDVLLD